MSASAILLLICMIIFCDGFFWPQKNNAYPFANVEYQWKSKSKYYYSRLPEKLGEILNGECLGAYKQLDDGIIQVPPTSSELFVSSFPVSKKIYDWWSAIPRPKQMRVEPFLCENVYNKKIPIFNNKGCQLPHYMSPSAPRCQTQYLKLICNLSSINVTDPKPNQYVLPEADHSTTFKPPVPWLLTARNSFVSMCGHIAGPCGFVHTTANCMATGYKVQASQFKNSCPMTLLQRNTSCFNASLCDTSLRSFAPGDTLQCGPKTPFSSSVAYHERVFVVGEVDDTFIYHIHLEILPRIVYHLDFLLANPDIKIMWGCDGKKGKGGTEQGLRQGLQALEPFLTTLGIGMERLVVHQHVLARDIYLPMEGGCQDPVYNTWQILTQRQMIMERLGLQREEDRLRRQRSDGGGGVVQKGYRPVMMLLKRSSGSKHTRNRFDLVRQWSDNFTSSLLGELSQRFPQYSVVLYSDKNETLMKCYPCQVREFARADVLIGVHGAGLGMQLYMKPNSAVVEFAPYGNDGRCLLGGGPFSRTAALMGHNYMMHHSPYEEFVWNAEEKCSEFNITRFATHIHSFLQSIDFL